MSRDFARSFYGSDAWKMCRAAYYKSKGGLCERCLKAGRYSPGEIVHHKIYLTPQNVHQPEVALCWDNLELLCRECHAAEHDARKRRYSIDENGRVEARG